MRPALLCVIGLAAVADAASIKQPAVASVGAGLTKAQVMTVLKGGIAELEQCIGLQGPAGTSLEDGRPDLMRVTFAVNPDGTRDPLTWDLEGQYLDWPCAYRVVDHWKFPAFKARQPAKVVITFHYRTTQAERDAHRKQLHAELDATCTAYLAAKGSYEERLRQAIAAMKGVSVPMSVVLAKASSELETPPGKRLLPKAASAELSELANKIDYPTWCVDVTAGAIEWLVPADGFDEAAVGRALLPVRGKLDGCALLKSWDPVSGTAVALPEPLHPDDRVLLRFMIGTEGSIGDDLAVLGQYVDEDCVRRLLQDVRVPGQPIGTQARYTFHFRTTPQDRAARIEKRKKVFVDFCSTFEAQLAKGPKESAFVRAATELLRRPDVPDDVRETLTMLQSNTPDATAEILIDVTEHNEGIVPYCPKLAAWGKGR